MDHRYDLIRPMYDKGHIAKLSDIFKFVPKTRVAKDAGMNLEQMNARIKSPDKFMGRQLFRIGALCGLTEEEMVNLLLAELRAKRAGKTP